MEKRNISTGNEDLFNATINILENFLKGFKKGEKNSLRLLIEILKERKSRVNYITVKSIAIIYGMFEVFESSFKDLGHSEIENLIFDLNNSFLEEDLNIHTDLEQQIINIIFETKNYKIDERIIEMFKPQIRELLNHIIASKDGKKRLEKEDIKNFLEIKLEKELQILRAELQDNEIYKAIEKAKRSVAENL